MFGRQSLFFAAVLALVVAPVLAAPQGPPGPKTVVVDCTRGQSINAALSLLASAQLSGQPTIIEIHGMCDENVTVRLDRITLRGRDPAQDGIRSLSDVPGITLAVRDSIFAAVQNLTIAGGSYGILLSHASGVSLSQCRVQGARFGVFVEGGTDAYANDISVSGSADQGAGFVVNLGSYLSCDRCTSAGYPTALSVYDGSFVRCIDCSMSATATGISSDISSHVRLASGNVVAPLSVVVSRASGVVCTGAQLAGTFRAFRDSSIEMRSVNQTANALDGNYVEGGSIARALASTTLLGPTWLDDFSNLVLSGGSTHAGDVGCNSASDFYCEDPARIGGATSGCRGCVVGEPRAAKCRPTPPAAPTQEMFEKQQ